MALNPVAVSTEELEVTARRFPVDTSIECSTVTFTVLHPTTMHMVYLERPNIGKATPHTLSTECFECLGAVLRRQLTKSLIRQWHDCKSNPSVAHCKTIRRPVEKILNLVAGRR